MSHRSLLGLALGASLLAVPALCQDPVPTQAPAPEKHLLRYRLQKDTKGHFVIAQQMATKMDMGGQTMNHDADMQLFVEFEVVGVVDGKAWTVRQRIHRVKVKMHMNNPGMGSIDYDSDDEDSDPGMLAQIEDMVGQTFKMKVDDRGGISDFEIPEGIAEDMDRMLGGDAKEMFNQVFPLLPEEPVAVGESWESSMSQPMGQMGKAEVKVKSKLVEVEGDRITLDQEMEMDLEGLETPFDMKMEVKKARGTAVLDLTKSFPVRSDLRMQVAMKAEIQGTKRDMEMEMSTSIQPGEPPAKKTGKEGDGKK